MSKVTAQHIPLTENTSKAMLSDLHSDCEIDANYTIAVDPESRIARFGLTPPIHAICESC